MAFKIPTISYIISKMTDEEKTFLTNVLNTTQVTEWEVIQTLPETKEICMAVMQIPKQRSCIGILWNNSKNDYYLIDIFSGYQTAIYHIKNNVITPVMEYCTTLEVRYWLTRQETEPANADPYLTKLKEIMAINDLDIEFGRNVEVDGTLKVNKDATINGGTALHTGNAKTIFGNKSLIKSYNAKGEVTDGNIDLFIHRIIVKSSTANNKQMFIKVQSSDNLKVDTANDLTTLLKPTPNVAQKFEEGSLEDGTKASLYWTGSIWQIKTGDVAFGVVSCEDDITTA